MRARDTDRDYDARMMPIALRAQTFMYGPIEIPYERVGAAGIALQSDRGGRFRTLMIAYQLPADAAPKLIYFRLGYGEAKAGFENDFRQRVADRWKGEAKFFAMRRLLGFSNRPAQLIIGTLLFAIAAGIVVLLLAK